MPFKIQKIKQRLKNGQMYGLVFCLEKRIPKVGL
jgi:hypothetical protein